MARIQYLKVLFLLFTLLLACFTSLTTTLTNIQIKNQHGSYYGEIGLGTPTQNFRVIFDTGSADLVVLNQDWFEKPPEQGNGVDHDVVATYNSTKSSTYEIKGQQLEMTYQQCALEGFVSNDVVTIGDIIIQKQDFIEATKETSGEFNPVGYDGILGLAFQGVSFGNLVPVLYNMIDQSLTEQKLFSMWLKKSDETKSLNEIQDGGIITFGGYDSAYFYGEHKYVPLVDDQGYWEFTMNEIFLGPQGSGLCMGIGGCRVFIDSGFPVIRGPEDLIESLNIALGGDEVGTVDCEKVPSLPQVIFTIGEFQYPLSASEYIKIRGDSCSTIFRPFRDVEEDDNPSWIFGEPFLWKYHTVFDYDKKSIGLAVAKQANEDISSPTENHSPPLLGPNYGSSENHSPPPLGSNYGSSIFWFFIVLIIYN